MSDTWKVTNNRKQNLMLMTQTILKHTASKRRFNTFCLPEPKLKVVIGDNFSEL